VEKRADVVVAVAVVSVVVLVFVFIFVFVCIFTEGARQTNERRLDCKKPILDVEKETASRTADEETTINIATAAERVIKLVWGCIVAMVLVEEKAA